MERQKRLPTVSAASPRGVYTDPHPTPCFPGRGSSLQEVLMIPDNIPEGYPAHELLFELLYSAIMEKDREERTFPTAKQTERRGLDEA